MPWTKNTLPTQLLDVLLFLRNHKIKQMLESDESSSSNKHPHICFICGHGTNANHRLIIFRKKWPDNQWNILRQKHLMCYVLTFKHSLTFPSSEAPWSLLPACFWFQAYVYDIRSSGYLHKLHNFSDTVLNVAFNPATTEVRSVL